MSQINANLANLMDDYTSFTFGTAKQYNVSAYQLEKGIFQGILTKPSAGTYVVAGHLEDEMSIISQHFSHGVFSQESALAFHDLSDEMPWRYTMTFPKGYHAAPGTLEDSYIQAQYRTGRYYSAGITTQLTPDKNKISIYSVERSLLDAWNSPDTQPYIKNDAAKRYMERRDRDYQELLTLERELYPKSTLSKVLEVIAQ
jgi:predicted transcriptional regulator of viral defense system